MSNQRKYFGTDGIRGRVGEHPITPEFILKLGWAAGKVLGSSGSQQILIGKDTRISGYMFESVLQAGLVAAGMNVRLLGPMPTPAIAYLTRTFHASAGIVISASHNPHYDNGIKFFSSEGKKFGDKLELAIEAQLDQPMEVVASESLGKVSRINSARGRYIEFCKSTLGDGIRLDGLRIVLDTANGACYDIAPDVFDELGADVVTIGAEPDGLNINQGVGSTQPQLLQQKVLEYRADLGIAFDGDGDRLILVDAEGGLVDGDEILFIIAENLQRKEKLNGGVVGTLMSNFGLELAFQKRNIPFARSNVGDRYVMELLQQRGWFLGGESSGHILCLDKTTTGDGIVSALQVLAAVVEQGKSLIELRRGMSKLPQHMINVEVADKSAVAHSEQVNAAVQQAEKRLAGRGRVLLRPSGTEPVVRVMAEGEDSSLVQEVTEQLAAVVSDAG